MPNSWAEIVGLIFFELLFKCLEIILNSCVKVVALKCFIGNYVLTLQYYISALHTLYTNTYDIQNLQQMDILNCNNRQIPWKVCTLCITNLSLYFACVTKFQSNKYPNSTQLFNEIGTILDRYSFYYFVKRILKKYFSIVFENIVQKFLMA